MLCHILTDVNSIIALITKLFKTVLTINSWRVFFALNTFHFLISEYLEFLNIYIYFYNTITIILNYFYFYLFLKRNSLNERLIKNLQDYIFYYGSQLIDIRNIEQYI